MEAFLVWDKARVNIGDTRACLAEMRWTYAPAAVAGQAHKGRGEGESCWFAIVWRSENMSRRQTQMRARATDVAWLTPVFWNALEQCAFRWRDREILVTARLGCAFGRCG
jgi:hypothetical protein